MISDPWGDFLRKLRLDPGTLPCSGDEKGLCPLIATLPSRCACGAWSYGWQCAEHVRTGHCMRCQGELEEARQRVAEKIISSRSFSCSSCNKEVSEDDEWGAYMVLLRVSLCRSCLLDRGGSD